MSTTVRSRMCSRSARLNTGGHVAARYDRPWRRPGAPAYARQRIRAFLHPPITVVSAPPDLIKDHDVAVPMRDGVTLRVNVYRPPGDGPFPVILSAHPYGKDVLP